MDTTNLGIMAIEIEKKYRLTPEQRQFVLDSLKEMGGQYVGEDFEENVIYSGEALAETGGILRIRKMQDRNILTFKKRFQNESDIKHQIEYETEVSDAGSLEKIIEELGLAPRLIYEKRRETWKFRSTEVVLDELLFGSFMEIEGAITAIKEAEMLLGIEDFETEHETYPRLTARLGSQNGNVIEARFVKDREET